MPITSEDKLKELLDASEEARQTIRELHEARAAALDVVKRQRREIAEAVKVEIEKAVHDLSADTRARLNSAVDAAINAIVSDWREKLGLS